MNRSRKFEGKGLKKYNCLIQEKAREFNRGNFRQKDSLARTHYGD